MYSYILTNVDFNIKRNTKLKYTCDPVLYTQSGVNFRECELIDKNQVTHDTDIYTFELPKSTKMSVPLGYHVFLRFSNGNFSRILIFN